MIYTMAPFKIAIVGGGMTGLTAALHLDRLGMDFVLLEAYSDITPEVGASLALYPNFQRVLDQLGVLDAVRDESSELRTLMGRDLDGNLMFQHAVADAIHATTGGYGIATFTRSQLLRILYRSISDEGKKKIHTGKRVSRIDQLTGDRGVRLHIEGGEPYDADVVIGADGINSIVRSEMWRMAQEIDPKAFQGDQGEDMVTEFGCVFGLSKHTGDLQKDHGYQICGQGITIGLFGGPAGEALWFIFFKVPGEDKPRRGRDTPKFTAEEGAEICRKYSGAKLTASTTFGDVWANRYRVTTQACPNHCLRRWTFGRLICLGDAVAKTNPILAQGGAQGAESVLMLIDDLYEASQRHMQRQKQNMEAESGSASTEAETLPKSEVERILARVNDERRVRVSSFVDKSQQVMCISAWSGWLFRIIGKYIVPLLPTWVIIAQALAPWKGAYISKTLPAPAVGALEVL
ncbi:hypothetical protein BX600DRAFT_464675 [Xylariales sp. PMI_506]|nr:hypothetical protein BX600DRAFT_464675 [Xylariales sp. PMI_506]